MCRLLASLLLLAFIIMGNGFARAQNTSWHGWHEHGGKPPAIATDTWAKLDKMVRDGYAAERRGDWHIAYRTFTEALPLAQADKDAVEFCRYRLARVCWALGKEAEARTLADQIMGSGPPSTVAPNDWYKALFLIQEAEETRYLFRFKEALRLWEQADALVASDAQTRVWTLHNIAYFNRRMGRWKASIEPCRVSEELLLKLGRQDDATELLEWQGIALIHTGHSDEGKAKIREAWSYWREKNPFRYGQSLISTSQALQADTLVSDEAEQLEREGHNLLRQWGVQAARDFMLQQGQRFLWQGRNDLALEAFHAVADEVGAQDDPGLILPAYEYLSNLYRTMGNRAMSLRYIERAYQTRRRIRPHDKPFAQRPRLFSLGQTFLTFAEWSRFEQVAQVLQSELDQMRLSPNGSERLGASFTYPSFLRMLAQARAKQGKTGEAVRAFASATDLFEQAGFDYEQAVTRTEWGELLQSDGRFYEALKQLEQAEVLLQTASVPDMWTETSRLRIRILTSKANLLRQTKQFARAETEYKRVVQTVEQSVRESDDGEIHTALQTFLLAQEQIGTPHQTGAGRFALDKRLASPYNGLADVVRQGSGKGEKAGAWQALLWVERGRVQGLARRVAESEALQAQLLPPDEAARLAQARRDSVGRIAEQVRRAAFVSLPERADRIAVAHADASDYASVKRQLSAKYPQFARVCTPPAPSVAKLKAYVQAHGRTLFLQWATVSERRTLLFAVYSQNGKAKAKVWALDTAPQSLGRECRRWYAALTENTIASAVTERKLARALYTRLLGPVEKAGLLGKDRFDRLVLISDGSLLSVPLGALESSDGTRLVERFPVSEAVSLHALTRSLSRVSSTQTSLLCAAPSFQLRNQEEAEQIARLFAPTVLLHGKQATEQAVRQRLGKARILHFATHGVLDGERGLRSFLSLSPSPPQSTAIPNRKGASGPPDFGEPLERDGRLEAREILELSLSADLAVLSACDTGQGQSFGGEGLMGFAWAFRAAGCPSIVASLWRVDDRATADLMTRFYRNLRQGKAKDVALQQAIITTRHAQSGRTFRPYYWAAFRLTGDISPLRLPHAPPKPAPSTATHKWARVGTRQTK